MCIFSKHWENSHTILIYPITYIFPKCIVSGALTCLVDFSFEGGCNFNVLRRRKMAVKNFNANNSSNTNDRSNGSGDTPFTKGQVWINVGIKTGMVDDNGEEIIVNLPIGLDLAFQIKKNVGGDSDYAKLSRQQNALLDNLCQYVQRDMEEGEIHELENFVVTVHKVKPKEEVPFEDDGSLKICGTKHRKVA